MDRRTRYSPEVRERAVRRLELVSDSLIENAPDTRGFGLLNPVVHTALLATFSAKRGLYGTSE